MRWNFVAVGVLVLLVLGSVAVGFKVGHIHVSLINSRGTTNVSTENVGKYLAHGIIKIDGNGDFDYSHGVIGGNGTKDNPYIIAGWKINAHGNSYGIWIRFTDAYFVIRDCKIENATGTYTAPYGGGIVLDGVTHGIVERNYISHNLDGILLLGGYDITIRNNSISYNERGIYFLHGSHSKIMYNDIFNNYLAIRIYGEHNNISDNKIFFNTYSISIYTEYNIISHNVILYNHGGIEFSDYGNNNTVSNNLIAYNNGSAVVIYSTNHNVVAYNSILYNKAYGVMIDDTSSSDVNNSIYGNYFYYNNDSNSTFNLTHFQAREDNYESVKNSWNTTTGIGNYWHDWADNNDTNDQNHDGIVDWPYNVYGTTPYSNLKITNMDYYPLKYAPPTPPMNLTAVAGNGYVNLSWERPLVNGTSNLTKYNLYRNGVLISSLSPDVLNYNDTDVVNGETYSYYITAVNSFGEGERSNKAIVIPAGIPTPPRNLKAIAGNRYVYLSWQKPSNDGGVITYYRIYRGESGSETLLAQLPSNVYNYTDRPLVNGRTYYYYVTAVNFAGESPRSNEVNATPITIPTPPKYLRATAGNGYVELEWLPPNSDGGSEIISYKIYRGNSSGCETFLVEVDGNILNYNDTSATNGITYYYYVTAVNLAGESNESNEISAMPLDVPHAPENLQATCGEGYVNLTWEKPSYDGGQIISYKIYRGTKSGHEIYLTEVNGSTLFYNDTSVTNGVTYYYYITANNSAGESNKSNEISVTPAGVPSAPRNLRAIVENGYVELTWQPPRDDGGADIIYYRIYRGNSSGCETFLAEVDANTLNYTDKSVERGVTYYYYITAVNPAREGNMSNEVNVSVPLETESPGFEPFLLGNPWFWWVLLIAAVFIVGIVIIIRTLRNRTKNVRSGSRRNTKI